MRTPQNTSRTPESALSQAYPLWRSLFSKSVQGGIKKSKNITHGKTRTSYKI